MAYFFDIEAPAARAEFVQWGICGAVVLMVHGLLVLALLSPSDEADLEAGPPVITIELSPIPVAPPAPPNDLAPGPLQPQAETEERERADARPEQQQERVQDVAQAPDPVVTLPPPVPKPVEKPPDKTAEQEPADATPVPTAPPVTETRAAQAASPAIVGWQRLLIAQLQRHKRYPPAAKGEQGVARLAFSIDRRGNLRASRIIQSSGSSILDEETLALIKRAAPFPAPPDDLTDAQLSFIVPIRFAASAGR